MVLKAMPGTGMAAQLPHSIGQHRSQGKRERPTSSGRNSKEFVAIFNLPYTFIALLVLIYVLFSVSFLERTEVNAGFLKRIGICVDYQKMDRSLEDQTWKSQEPYMPYSALVLERGQSDECAPAAVRYPPIILSVVS